MELYELTITEACRQMAAGNISAIALTQSCLDRIEEIDKDYFLGGHCLTSHLNLTKTY